MLKVDFRDVLATVRVRRLKALMEAVLFMWTSWPREEPGMAKKAELISKFATAFVYYVCRAIIPGVGYAVIATFNKDSYFIVH